MTNQQNYCFWVMNFNILDSLMFLWAVTVFWLCCFWLSSDDLFFASFWQIWNLIVLRSGNFLLQRLHLKVCVSTTLSQISELFLQAYIIIVFLDAEYITQTEA